MTKLKNKLFGYALHFTSFLLESGVEPKRVILFGSVARSEADKESDVDLFVDMSDEAEEMVRSAQKIFSQTFGEKWSLKGVLNPLSVVVGDLDSKKWQHLKRTMQSHGILLYGKYTEQPKGLSPYFIFRLNFVKLSRAKRMRVWRILYGYSQKVGKKVYKKRGLIEELRGKKLEKSIVAIPREKFKEMKEFLVKQNIGFSVNEVWSDNL